MPFRTVIAQHGHRRLIELLSQSVAKQSLPPSLVFAGPSGIGKRETAIALAQALNCTSAQDRRLSTGERRLSIDDSAAAEGCGRCLVCTRIARGVHPDVLVVEPGDNGSIKIEQVRDVIDRAGYRPFEGRRRVVIIDDADAMVHAAQNALLKTLEEPPPASIFVLVTTRPDALLGTVRSRCIQLRFSEGAAHTVDPDTRQVAARVLAHVMSAPDARRRLEAAPGLLTNTGGGGAGNRETLAAHLRAMSSLLRDAALVAASRGDAALASPDARPLLDELAQVFHGGRAVRAFDAVERALDALGRNAA